MGDSLSNLYNSILPHREATAAPSRTAKLFRDGMTKIAKKVAEEAVEVGLETVQGNRDGVILESADLLYNLCVLWAAAGVTPGQVYDEIERREKAFGIAEKLPKNMVWPAPE